jgi:hypothetical protein
MGVPYPTASFEMFNTGSSGNNVSSSIRGAQKFDASDSVNTVTQFSNLINAAQVPLFDERYAGPNIFELSDISASLQWRGYPVDITCYTCSFEEIGDPAIKNITFSCSILDPTVEFKVTSSGVTSPINGAINITASIDDVASAKTIDIGSDETFVGWSYSGDESTGILSTNASNYSHTVVDDITIYAIVGLSDAISQEFCYYSAATDQNTVCGSCSTTVTVYFDRDLYTSNPLEDLIWYNSAALTTLASEGQYRQKSTYTTRGWFGSRTRILIDDTIYYVSGSGAVTPGAANIYKTCTDGFIYCS